MLMGMSLSDVVSVLRIVETVVVLVLGIYLFISRNQTANRKETDEKIGTVNSDLKDTNRKIERHGQRISVLEESVRCAPSHKDLGEIYGKVNKVSESVQKIEGAMKGMNNTVQLIHKHLLDSAKGSDA
jgi:uncharacterized protein YoxC